MGQVWVSYSNRPKPNPYPDQINMIHKPAQLYTYIFIKEKRKTNFSHLFKSECLRSIIKMTIVGDPSCVCTLLSISLGTMPTCIPKIKAPYVNMCIPVDMSAVMCIACTSS